MIQRLETGGVKCFVYAFSGNHADSHHVTYLRETYFRYFWYLLRSLMHFKNVLKYASVCNETVLKGALRWGRYSLITRNNPGVIHIHHMQVLNSHFLKFLELKKIPWIISLRGFETAIQPLLNKDYYDHVKSVLSSANGIHTVSEDLKQRALALGASGDRINVIKRTVEVEKAIERVVSFGESPIMLTSIGRFNWKKGFVFLLQAIRILVDDNIPVVLNLCGDGDEKEQAEIRYWIWLLNLEHFVVLHGFLDSNGLSKVLAKTHVYIQPSINEGIPNTLLRALINRIPIVASDVDGIPEVVLDNIHGVLVPPGQPTALAEGVKRIIEDEKLRQTIASAPLSVSLNPQLEVTMYKKFYTNLININTEP
ncbi:MAG: glycosyltransferase family 4 protein [Cyclobacteriaceae bacterium]